MFNSLIETLINTKFTYDIIGIAGFIFYMLSYALLQLGRISGNGICYIVMNMCAATLVLITLFQQFNLASLLIQLAWILISIVGLIRLWRNRNTHKAIRETQRHTENTANFSVSAL